ncbi:hypothetical protein C0993_008424 [Termitomyces sp. T159_Od127]|nr:hypothetical protein C0993_008424 [Termitomyces sp. T159_Od127]
MDDVIHEVLEGGGGVGHTKAIAGAEGGLLFMLQGYADVVVAGVEVNFGVDFGAAEVVNKVTNEGKWILVLFGDFVEALVVTTHYQPLGLQPPQNHLHYYLGPGLLPSQPPQQPLAITAHHRH